MFTPSRDIDILLGDSVTEAIVLHGPNGVIRYAAPGCERLLEMPSDEIQGSNLLDRLDESERKRVKQAFVRCALRGQAYGPTLVRAAAPVVRWFEVRTQPVRDRAGHTLELHTVIRDLTARIRFHEDLSMREALEREANELAAVGGWMLDLRAGSLYWSPEVRRIHEVGEDFVPTLQSAVDFYAPEARPVITQAVEETIATGQPRTVELPLVTARGRKIWVRALLRSHMEGGRAVRLYGALQDVTERKAYEEKMSQLVDELTWQRDRLAEFGHIVTHHLRGPVCNLVTLSDMMKEGRDESAPREDEELVDHVADAAKQLLATFDDVTTAVTSVDTDHLPNDTIDVQDMLLKIVTGLSADIQRSSARISWDITHCPKISYPTVYFETIVRNLIENALTYTVSGRRPVIHIRTWMDGTSPCLSVADNGSGIDLGRYGDAVFRLRTTFHRGRSGRGTGLFTIRHLIESLDGDITVDSTPDVGSTFIVN
ncbi:MAG TPA: hypothetical protein DIS79_04830, partial [Bacteroidetes bacterium]|nr:hypothetical protein [Bacteroidota bacterium]